MKKICIIVLCSIWGVFFLGIGAYFLFWQNNSPRTGEVPNVSPDIQPTTYAEKRAQVDKLNMQNAELYNTAMQEQDTTLCERITNPDQKTECKDMIGATKAKKSGTIESCDTLALTGSILLCRDVIWSDQAIIATDRSLCDKISESNRKSHCQEALDESTLRSHIESHTLTPEFCKTLTNKYQTDCISQLQETNQMTLYREATSKNDTAICEKLTNTELRENCQDVIHLKTAISTQKSSLCESILSEEKKLYCQNQVSKIIDKATSKKNITPTDSEKGKNNNTIAPCETPANNGNLDSCQRKAQ